MSHTVVLCREYKRSGRMNSCSKAGRFALFPRGQPRCEFGISESIKNVPLGVKTPESSSVTIARTRRAFRENRAFRQN